MIVVCNNCSSRLQVDESKAPAANFNIRCPKCNSSLELASASPASEKGALGIGGSPSTEHRRYEQPKAAPLFESARAGKDIAKMNIEISETEKLAQLLANLLAPSVVN